MTTTYLSPILNDAQFNDDGTFLVGGLIWFYVAGTTTSTAAYTTNTTSTPWPNPIVLDARGETGGEIWLDPSISYKMVLESEPMVGQIHGVVISTFDNIQGINVPQVSSVPSDWALFPGTPTRLTNTSFSVPGDHRSIFQFNRRVWTLNSSGNIYSTIKGAIYSLGVTNVTVVNDSGVLDSGLNAVYYGVVETSPSSIPRAVLLGSSTTTTTDNIYISQSAGRLQQAINTASPSSNWPIDVTGNLTGNVTGNLTGNVTGNVTGNLTGNVYALDGSSALPSISFSTDSPHSTGIYKISSGNIGFSSGGTLAASISSTGVAAIDGSIANPSINFISEPGLGLCRLSSHTLGFASNAFNPLQITPQGIGARAGSGTASIFFIGEETTGFAKPADNEFDVNIVNSKVATFSANGISVAHGNVTNPGVSFLGDTSTGFSADVAGTIKVSSAGADVAEFSAAGIKSVVTAGGALNPVLTIENLASAFSGTLLSPGYIKMPNNLIFQWGGATLSATGYATTIASMPYSWTGGLISYLATHATNGTPAPTAIGVTSSGSLAIQLSKAAGSPAGVSVVWFAIGYDV